MRFLLFSFLLFPACNDTKKTDTKTPDQKPAVHFPIAAKQSTEFEIGQPSFIKMILDIWRAYDRGDVVRFKENFAPQLTIMLPEQYMQGNRDTVLAQFQQKRDNYTTVQTTVDSWVPLTTTDTKENFVFVWGRRELTQKDRKILFRTILEKWRINAQGQIDFMQHYVNEAWDSTP